MKRVVMTINRCKDCTYKTNKGRCSKTGDTIIDPYTLPDDCPLPEIDEFTVRHNPGELTKTEMEIIMVLTDFKLAKKLEKELPMHSKTLQAHFTKIKDKIRVKLLNSK